MPSRWDVLLPGWLVTLASAWLLMVCSLFLWSMAPVVLGWQPTVVLTGSMLPKVSPGDVVLVDPGRSPRLGQVALLRDDLAPSGRVLHRVVEMHPDGTFISQGDANPTADTTVRNSDDVLGVARLVVPGAGRTALLRNGTASPRDRVWVWITLCAAAVAAVDRLRAR